jgi:hypothetical protein
MEAQRPEHPDPLLPGLPVTQSLLDQAPKLVHGGQEQRKRKAHVSRFPVQFFVESVSLTNRGPLVIWKYELGLGASAGLHSKFGLRNFAGRP